MFNGHVALEHLLLECMLIRIHMTRSFFAMIKDPYAKELRIRIFNDNDQAERARKSTGSRDSEVIRFLANDSLLVRPLNMPLYLAITNEDEGIRIHAAFGSLLGSQTFLMNYTGETTCRMIIAWPDPLQWFNTEVILPLKLNLRSA